MRIKVEYPTEGTTEILDVEVLPGETPEEAIMARGRAQHEFRVVSETPTDEELRTVYLKARAAKAVELGIDPDGPEISTRLEELQAAGHRAIYELAKGVAQ